MFIISEDSISYGSTVITKSDKTVALRKFYKEYLKDHVEELAKINKDLFSVIKSIIEDNYEHEEEDDEEETVEPESTKEAKVTNDEEEETVEPESTEETKSTKETNDTKETTISFIISENSISYGSTMITKDTRPITLRKFYKEYLKDHVEELASITKDLFSVIKSIIEDNYEHEKIEDEEEIVEPESTEETKSTRKTNKNEEETVEPESTEETIPITLDSKVTEINEYAKSQGIKIPKGISTKKDKYEYIVKYKNTKPISLKPTYDITLVKHDEDIEADIKYDYYRNLFTTDITTQEVEDLIKDIMMKHVYDISRYRPVIVSIKNVSLTDIKQWRNRFPYNKVNDLAKISSELLSPFTQDNTKPKITLINASIYDRLKYLKLTEYFLFSDNEINDSIRYTKTLTETDIEFRNRMWTELTKTNYIAGIYECNSVTKAYADIHGFNSYLI